MKNTFDMELMTTFINSFGSYLDIQRSFVTVSSIGKSMNQIIPSLLKVASFDPLHLKASKAHMHDGRVSYTYSSISIICHHLILFIMVKMVISSVVEHLSIIVKENIPLLVKAFPDLRAWQVEIASAGKESTHYYKYLTQLLNIKDGKYAARMDADLVAVSLL